MPDLTVIVGDTPFETQVNPSGFAAPGSENALGINTNDDTSQKIFDKLNLFTLPIGSNGDPIPAWVGGQAYTAEYEFTFSTTSSTAVDVDGRTLEANTVYIAHYPANETSALLLDDTEIARFKVLGTVGGSVTSTATNLTVDSSGYAAPGGENSLGLNTDDDTAKKIFDKLESYTLPAGNSGDPIPDWVSGQLYGAKEKFVFSTTNTIAVDINGRTLTPNISYIGFYPSATTANGTLTNAEMATIEVLGDVGGGAAQYIPITETILRDLAASGNREVVYLNNEVSISADIVLPEKITIEKGPLGFISTTDPTTVVEINGEINAGHEELFKGDFRVILGKKFAKAEWFEPVMNDGVIDENYAVVTPSTGKIVHALRKAKFAVKDGGKILIGEGVFTGEDVPEQRRRDMLSAGVYRERVAPIQFYESIDTGGGVIREFYDDLTICGSGMGKTIVVGENGQTGGAISYAIYRNGGWVRDFASVATYEPEVYVGAASVTLRAGEDPSIYTPGTKVGLVGGSSYSDQDDMQMNIVSSVDGQVVNMEFPWEKEFSVEASSALTFTLQPFTTPAVGGTVTIKVQDNIGNAELSVGNDAYSVVSVTEIVAGSEYDVVIQNLGKGNSTQGTVYPIYTGLYKSRVLMLLTNTPKNLEISDLTAVGRRDIHVNSNAVNITSKRIEGILATQDNQGGLTFNADGGYGFISSDSVYRSTNQVAVGQIARSYIKVHHFNDEFYDMAIEHTEFAYDARFDKCKFYINKDYKTPGNSRNTVVRLGATGGGVIINNCDFFIKDAASVFSSDGIGQFQATAGQGYQITNNRFYLNNVDRWWSVNGGNGIVSGNQIYGNLVKLLGATATAPFDDGSVFGFERTEQGRSYNVYNWGGPVIFTNNSFSGYIDAIVTNALENVVVKDFIVTRHGPADRVASSIAGPTLVTISNTPGEVPYHVDVEFDVWGWDMTGGGEFGYSGATPKDGNRIRFNIWKGVYAGDVIQDEVICVGDCLEAKDIPADQPIAIRNYIPVIAGAAGTTVSGVDSYSANAVSNGDGTFSLTNPGTGPETFALSRTVRLIENTADAKITFTATNAQNNRAAVLLRGQTDQEGIIIQFNNYNANDGFVRIYQLSGGSTTLNPGGASDVPIDWPDDSTRTFQVTISDVIKVYVEGVEVVSYNIFNDAPASGHVLLLDRFGGSNNAFTEFSNLSYLTNVQDDPTEFTGFDFTVDGADFQDSQIKVVSPTLLNSLILSGEGTPEASVIAVPGTLYLNRLGGTNTSLYVKETGSGNTGWVAK